MDNIIQEDIMETDKVILSLQIPKDILVKLKEHAWEECTSVSYLVRKLLIQYVRGLEDNK